ncbi:hypothetical protein [Sunxiuqinia elliptica]|nr:hypothetical protein [Sunxiuqinia elliptica]
MKRAWYPFQVVDSIRFQENNNFIIANINNKPIDFVSSEEQAYRRLASEEPWSESFFNEYKRTEYKDYQAYLSDFRKTSQEWDSLALNENKIANSMDMAVWIQNQTNDTIFFPNQDGSLIAIIESKNKKGNWKPIQYWWFSWCGNSYEDLILPPNNSIQIGLNNQLGGIPTKMRLKVHGRDTLYLSNEFNGKVSIDDFVINYQTRFEMLEDKERISFLDSVHYGLTVFPDPPEIIIIEEENE